VLCKYESGGAAGGGGGGGGGWWCVLVGMVENRERTDWCCSYQSFSISPISHNHSLTPSHHHHHQHHLHHNPPHPHPHHTPPRHTKRPPSQSGNPLEGSLSQPGASQLSFHRQFPKQNQNLPKPKPKPTQPNQPNPKPNQGKSPTTRPTSAFFRFWWLVTIKWRTLPYGVPTFHDERKSSVNHSD